MTRGMSKTQASALDVIRSHGGSVWVSSVSPGVVCCGIHRCSFSATTVRALAARGLLTRHGDNPERYVIVPGAALVTS